MLGNCLLSCPCSMQQILDPNNSKALIKAHTERRLQTICSFTPQAPVFYGRSSLPLRGTQSPLVQGLRAVFRYVLSAWLNALHRQPTTVTAQLYTILPLLQNTLPSERFAGLKPCGRVHRLASPTGGCRHNTGVQVPRQLELLEPRAGLGWEGTRIFIRAF